MLCPVRPVCESARFARGPLCRIFPFLSGRFSFFLSPGRGDFSAASRRRGFRLARMSESVMLRSMSVLRKSKVPFSPSAIMIFVRPVSMTYS